MFNSSQSSPAQFNANGGAALLNPVNTIWNAWQVTANQLAATATLGVASGGVTAAMAAQGAVQASVEGLAGWYNILQAAASTNSPMGNSAGTVSAHWRVRYAPLLRVYFRTGPSIAALRYLIGYGANNFLSNDFVGAAANGCGIRFSTSSSDPGWMGVQKNVAGTVTATNLQMAVAINSEYLMTIEVSLTEITYRIKNLATFASVRVTVPNTMTGANPVMGGELIIGGATLENVSKQAGCNRVMQYYRVTETIQE